ncbi:hypothetical protein CDL15_Pgr018370 [Punica granatum]|uniref:Uncharacterized protein n=1 Tax=Punica granatum TaxID=22663 RepID=A0A218WI71_PUNGR|nr:hypothetical protein CDL15_Pgr018370 [Punica granatum]
MAEERQPVVSRARDTTDAGTLSTTRRAGYIASLCICGIFRRSSDASPSSGTGAIQRHRPRALHRTRRQVNQLAANMNTNMAELMGMLRNQNRTSSSYTPPPEYRPTVDLNQVVPPIYVTDNEDLSFSTMAVPSLGFHGTESRSQMIQTLLLHLSIMQLIGQAPVPLATAPFYSATHFELACTFSGMQCTLQPAKQAPYTLQTRQASARAPRNPQDNAPVHIANPSGPSRLLNFCQGSVPTLKFLFRGLSPRVRPDF